MSHQVLSHQSENINISTPVYEGPLDLLLELIERAELDITTIALAQVTDQYLAYLQNLVERDPGEVSAFLVIAAKLIQIKSEALLPRPPEREPGDEDPGESLAQMLIVYKRYKELGAWLQQRTEQNLRTYLRLASPVHIETQVDLSGIDIHQITAFAEAIFRGDTGQQLLSQVISIPLVTIHERIHSIISTLRHQDTVSFSHLLKEGRTRLEMIVTFLAVLELIKRYLVIAHQDNLFSDIDLQPSQSLSENAEISAEFL